MSIIKVDTVSNTGGTKSVSVDGLVKVDSGIIKDLAGNKININYNFVLSRENDYYLPDVNKYYKMQLNQTKGGNSSYYSYSAGGSLTIPKAGIYFVSFATMKANESGSNTQVYYYLTKNSTTADGDSSLNGNLLNNAFARLTENTGLAWAGNSTIINLSAGDEIDLFTACGESSSKLAFNSYSLFSIVFLGGI